MCQCHAISHLRPHDQGLCCTVLPRRGPGEQIYRLANPVGGFWGPPGWYMTVRFDERPVRERWCDAPISSNRSHVAHIADPREASRVVRTQPLGGGRLHEEWPTGIPKTKKNLRVLPEHRFFISCCSPPRSPFPSLSLARVRVPFVRTGPRVGRQQAQPAIHPPGGISQAALRLAAMPSAPLLPFPRLLPSTESRASEANRSHNSRKCSRRAGGDGTGPPLARTPPATVAQVRTCIRWPPRS